MAALTVGGSFLSASLQVLFDKLSSPAILELGSVWGVKHELSRLRRTLMKILSIVSDTEMREIRDHGVKVWVKELKEVAYDAENILDEFEAEVVRQRLENGSPASYLSSLSPNQVLFRLDISKKISIVRERLDDVAKDKDDLRLGELLDGRNQVGTMKQRESSSLLCRSLIFGRDEDCDTIVELLVSDNKNRSDDFNIPAVIITGIGGAGKTALAKLIYNDERISNHFQLKMWVHVSEDFDVRRTTREIMESCSAKGGSDFVNWNMLQEKLKEEIRGKQFLLVLDDVWDDDRSKWEQLCLPFAFANPRSRLVITTRNASLLNITSPMTTLYSLEVLSDEECWKIFKANAFVNGISVTHPKLEVIGKSIVKKLQGLPLAAKAVGGLLCSKLDEEMWRTISESELWEYPQCGKDILLSLQISYQHLPAHLKHCYGYCSLFPKDYEFEKTKLIQIWNAQGFIPPRGDRRIEDIANECFNELLNKSFFKRFEESYLMHDMIHDLARYVSLDECFRVQDRKLHEIPENARHLSLICGKINAAVFNQLTKFKSLRTLLLQGCSSGFHCIPEDLFIKLRYIRVLDLSSNGIKELPDSIDSLKQLRYLDLSKNNIVRLPNSIGSLYNLQTLNVEACELHELPRTMSNMLKLRHLHVTDDKLVSTISYLGKLVNLQELVKFNVLNKDGHSITELKNMAGLQKIHISKLESIESKEEAQESKLNDKKFLRILTLEWSYNRGVIATELLEAQVLEGLQPHQNLRELKIWNNAGATPPNWLANHSLSNIEAISICNCKNWAELPAFGELQFLSFLEFSGMENVRRIDHHFYGGNQIKFPSLIELRFIDMPELREWLNMNEDNSFPCLQELLIVSCPKLENLPPLPPTLARLWMRKTGLKIVPDLSRYCQIERNNNTSVPSLLTTMMISDCPNLTLLNYGLLRYRLSYLETLSITNCAELTVSEEDDAFPALATLKTLTIDRCPKLTALIENGLPPGLAHLKLGGSSSLKFRCLQNLTSLYSLSISDCPCITSLSEESFCNLIALEELTISSCKELKSLHVEALISLKRLTVENCPLLEYSSLPRSSSLEYLELNNVLTVSGLLQNLTSLLSLRIQNCLQLTSFTEEDELEKLKLLQSLHILDCGNLVSLPTKLHCLASLERMYLVNCPRVHSLPESGLPRSLKLVDIRGCPILESRCNRGGQEWHKISHISNIHNA